MGYPFLAWLQQRFWVRADTRAYKLDGQSRQSADYVVGGLCGWKQQ
ncbi:MAG: hypothetical protein AAAB35_01785 [Phyllobacterium sp.]